MTDPKTRRFFLGAVTAAAATRVWGANDKINIAIVGLGGRGTNHLNQYSHLPESRVAVLCDVNQAAREVAQATLAKGGFEKAKEFEDMRQAFADPGVDAVSIATPESLARPRRHLGDEGRQGRLRREARLLQHLRRQKMVEVQRATGKLMQVGSQHRSTPFKMKAIAAMQQGLIGKIYHGEGSLLQAAQYHRPHRGRAHASRRELGSLPGPGAHAAVTTRSVSSTTGTGSGTPATATSATRASMRWASPAGAWAIPNGRRPPYRLRRQIAYRGRHRRRRTR